MCRGAEPAAAVVAPAPVTLRARAPPHPIAQRLAAGPVERSRGERRASIRFEDVHKTYPNGYTAVRGISLDEIAHGEFVVLLGPSGCRKTTTPRMVAGLETPTHGRIYLDDDVTHVPPRDRNIAMVFPSYALYPHTTVRENLAFGLKMRGVPKDEIALRIETVAKTLGLEGLLDHRPHQLSGGERQRVALGRAIVRKPRAFLLDEPLSNLDAKLRVQTRAELARLHRHLRATLPYVTHDREEALTLGDRIAVMHEGLIQQVAPPMEVYRRPANTFVAGFVGSPAMNFFPGTLASGHGALRVQCPAFHLALDQKAAPHSARARCCWECGRRTSRSSSPAKATWTPASRWSNRWEANSSSTSPSKGNLDSRKPASSPPRTPPWPRARRSGSTSAAAASTSSTRKTTTASTEAERSKSHTVRPHYHNPHCAAQPCPAARHHLENPRPTPPQEPHRAGTTSNGPVKRLTTLCVTASDQNADSPAAPWLAITMRSAPARPTAFTTSGAAAPRQTSAVSAS